MSNEDVVRGAVGMSDHVHSDGWTEAFEELRAAYRKAKYSTADRALLGRWRFCTRWSREGFRLAVLEAERRGHVELLPGAPGSYGAAVDRDEAIVVSDPTGDSVYCYGRWVDGDDDAGGGDPRPVATWGAPDARGVQLAQDRGADAREPRAAGTHRPGTGSVGDGEAHRAPVDPSAAGVDVAPPAGRPVPVCGGCVERWERSEADRRSALTNREWARSGPLQWEHEPLEQPRPCMCCGELTEYRGLSVIGERRVAIDFELERRAFAVVEVQFDRPADADLFCTWLDTSGRALFNAGAR